MVATIPYKKNIFYIRKNTALSHFLANIYIYIVGKKILSIYDTNAHAVRRRYTLPSKGETLSSYTIYNRDTLAVRRRNMLPLDSTVIIIKNIGSNIIRNTTFFFTVVLDNTWGCLCWSKKRTWKIFVLGIRYFDTSYSSMYIIDIS